MASPQRIKRVSHLVRQELSDIVRTEFSEPGMDLVSLPEVRVTGDLKQAEVFVNHVGSREDRRRAVGFLRSKRVRIQQLLGARIQLRETPQLRFVEDEAIDRGSRILQIMDELEQDLSPQPPPVPPEKGTDHDVPDSGDSGGHS